MADTNSINNALGSGLTSLAANGAGASGSKKTGSELGKTEFLQLLVTQLKNQDPLDPMKNDQFAVNLAQFSQLEQLISINDKVTKGAGSDLTSLAGYLGHEVTINSEAIEVSGGDGGMLKVKLAKDVKDVTIDLIGEDGSVAETLSTGELSAGTHSIKLTGLDSPNGEYAFKVKAQATQGGDIVPEVQVAGVVTGFIPGDDPTLMLGKRQIKPGDITEVSLPTAG